MKRRTLQMILLLPILTAAFAPVLAQAGETADAVEYLLGVVAESGYTFERNDDTHDAQEAARHMRKKYQHFQKKIKTPEDFIRLAATRSLLSGKSYAVHLPDGSEVPTADWLREALNAYRKGGGS